MDSNTNFPIGDIGNFVIVSNIMDECTLANSINKTIEGEEGKNNEDQILDFTSIALYILISIINIMSHQILAKNNH